MLGQIFLLMTILVFLVGSASILFSIFFENDNSLEYVPTQKKKVTRVEDVDLYYEDIEEVLELDEGLLE